MRSLPQCPRTPPQTGLRAALLAERGIAASLVALEGRYGLLSVFPVQPDLAALSGELGARFEISRNFYKPYACGIVIHPIVDAYLRLRRENAIDAEQIARVDIKAFPGAMGLCNRRSPLEEMQAHVSLHRWNPVCFLRGTTRIEDLDTETAVRDPAPTLFFCLVG